MSITIKDIAKRLDLSDATVSRILNNKKNFQASEKTREMVFKIAEVMGYRRNHAARALVTGRTNLVSFWSPGIAFPYFGSVAGYFQSFIRSLGYEMITCEYGDTTKISTLDAGLSQLQVDGIFFLGGGPDLDQLLRDEAVRGVPVVQCSTNLSDKGGCDLVYVDIFTPALEAMRHLVSSGCKSIAFIGACYDQEPRYQAYRQTLEEADLELNPCVILPSVVRMGTSAVGRESIKKHIEAHGCPDAVFCRNDELAIGAYRGLLDLGIRVPEDVALIGCDGIWETEYLEVPITTIVQPIAEMVETAWGFLTRRMQDKTTPIQKAHIKARLTIRESSRR